MHISRRALFLSNLSSNWKALQQKIQHSQANGEKTSGIKRVREHDERPPKQEHVNDAVEKQRTIARKRRKMGSFSSKLSATMPDPAADTNSLHAFAREHSLDAVEVAAAYGSLSSTTSLHHAKDSINAGLSPSAVPGRYLALDCEMVGTGPPPHNDSLLARVSIVNFLGEQVYDSYVVPQAGVEVADYRTHVSGIQRKHLRPGYARPFKQVQQDVAAILDGRILVGHALKNDLSVLMLNHPPRDIRDTARYAGFRELSMGKTPALRKLAKEVLGLEIQTGEHSSVEDARAAMLLFKREKAGFEQECQKRYGRSVPRSLATKERAAQLAAAAVERDGADEEFDEELDENEEEAPDGENGSAVTMVKSRRKKKQKKRTKR
ncbi:3'-5' exonuclease [Elasticomyces elasticus]|nr:3'-5' exonuclease [Elasticomyces elasticus]